MKLESVRIKNFMAIKEASLQLAAVNKIVGPNTNGKSSVVQAMRFCLSGLAPEFGITKKNMAHLLAHNGGAMLVEVAVNGGDIYTRNAANKTAAVLSDELLAGVVFDSQAFVEMTAKDRQRLVQQFAAADNAETITKTAHEHGFSQDVIAKILESMDAAQKWAISERQAAGRRITELQADIEAIPTIEFVSDSGKKLDLSKYTIDQIDSNITRYTARRDELIVVTKTPAASLDELTELRDAAKEDIESLSDDAGSEAVEQARKTHAEAEKAYRAKEQEFATAQAAIKQTNAAIEKASSKSERDCPECGQKVTKDVLCVIENRLIGQLNEQEVELKKITKARNDAYKLLNKAAETLSQKRQAVESLVERRENLTQVVEDYNRLIDIETNRATYNDELAEITTKLASLGKLKTAKTQYDEANKTRPRLESELEQARKNHKQMDMLDSMLKPEGALRQLANQTGDAMDIDSELAEAWDMADLTLHSDGSMTLGGRPIELSGKHSSEKFRAGVLMAEMICRAADTGVLILDGLEILTKAMAKELSKAVSRWRETYSTIILLASQDDKPEPSKYDWFKLFWAEGGKVEEIK
jgi:DNA repair exonuclease SbcCD ATPase subunit